MSAEMIGQQKCRQLLVMYKTHVCITVSSMYFLFPGLPTHWTSMPDDQKFTLVQLSPTDKEYTQVLQAFQQTCSNPVTKVT